jgi:hypothetical protein
MSVIKRYKCDFCGVLKDSSEDVAEAIEQHCCHDCYEVVDNVLKEVATYTIQTGKVPQDKKEFSVMMYNLSLRAEENE